MRPSAILILIVFSFIVASTSFAQSREERGLTKILRDTCLMMPKILPPEEMIKDIHYRTTIEDEWHCDDDDYDCDTYELTWVDYRYTTIFTYEYWSADGRLVTTNKEKITSKDMGTSREGVREAIKNLEKSILKTLHTSDHQACEDSHYKL